MAEATITVRIPEELKLAVENACAIDGMTLSGFVRGALLDKLGPAARTYELPGFSEQASVFFGGLHEYAEVLLLLVDRQGRRFYFHGTYLRQFSSETLVVCAPLGPGESVAILRRDLVAWFATPPPAVGSSAIMALRQTLDRGGWQPYLVRTPEAPRG